MLYTRIICYINLYSSDENVCPMCLSCPLFRVVPPTALPASRGNYDRITKRPVICSTSTSFVICFRYAIIVPPTSCKICWGNHASGSSLSNLCCSCTRFTSPCFAICFQLYLMHRFIPFCFLLDPGPCAFDVPQIGLLLAVVLSVSHK